MLQGYFIVAWRNILRNKLYSAINIVGLATGMTIALLIGLWLKDELTFNHIHKNHKQLSGVWVTTTHDGVMQTGPAISIPLVAELRSNYSNHFKNLALASWNWNHTLSIAGEELVMKEGMYTEPTFPGMFSLQAVEGNLSSGLTEPFSVILAESVAQTLFGEESAVGKSIRLDNTYEVKITAVYKDFPISSEFKRVKLLLPWSLHEREDWVKNNMTNWENHSWQLFAQIQDNRSIENVSKLITDVEKKFNRTGNPTLLLHPMDRWHLYETFTAGVNTGGKIQYVWLFGIAGVFVVLLACINFMNLSTARSEKRAREVGVRKAIGSDKGQLVIQFLSESCLMTALSFMLTIVLTSALLPVFNGLVDKDLILPVTDYKFWLVMVVFSLSTALLAGSYPAFYLSSLKPLNTIKGIFRVGKSGVWMRQALVVFQFTISIALIAGTLIVYQQIEFSKNRSLGYSKDRLIYSGTIPEMKGKYDQLRNELMQTGAVAEVSESSGPTTDIWSNDTGYTWEGKDPNSNPVFGTLSCTHDFGKTINWKMKEGRDFSRNFATDSTAIILNESAARLIGGKDILGKQIVNEGESFHVIGVVEDLLMESPYAAIRPTIFSLDYKWSRVINIRLTANMPIDEAIAKVEATLKKLSPNSVFEFRFAEEEYNAKFTSENRVSQLARLFALLAIFVACLGLFGLSTFVAEQRQKEIGIRKILGASVASIAALLSTNFLRLVFLAIIIASPVSYYLAGTWLQNFAYRIEITGTVFALAGFTAVAIALLTVSFQSLKIAFSNPVNSLRTE